MPLLEELPGTFESKGQVGGAAPPSRTPPAPPLTPRWHFPICCVASYALRSGLNCLQELIVQALGPQTTCQLVQVGVLLVCPSPTRGWEPHWGGY